MSRENNFHKLIESQNTEEKSKSWSRVQQNVDFYEEETAVQNGFTLALEKRKKLISLISIFATVIVAAAGIFLGVWLSRNKNSGPHTRYCSEGDYYIEDVDINLKEYSQQINSKLLYFDSYEDWGYLDSLYKLNEQDEVICIVERVDDEIKENSFTLYVTDNRTKIKTLSSYDLLQNTKTIGENTVFWRFDYGDAYAKFEYDGYVYYLMVEQAESIEIAFYYVELLLK